MKNLILILFLGLSLSLVTPSKVHSQTITPTGETYISQTQATPDQAQPQQNFFQKILGKVKNGLTYGVLTLLIGVLIPSPWKTIIKTITGSATVILK